jgi:lysosomal acid phosphatase
MKFSLGKFCLINVLALSVSTQTFAANEKLIFALDLIRHGDRTPYDDLPSAPHTWSEGLGQLTAAGMQQEYQLGLKLHQRYMVDHQLLASTYQADTIYIRSTDYDRTIMSAQSVMLGLYPLGSGPSAINSLLPALPSAFQPVPIHTIPAAQDGAYLIDIGSGKIAELISRYVYTRADWKEKSNELANQYERWSQLTGVNITGIFDVLSLGDTLRAYESHGIAMPAGLTSEEARKIIEASDWIYAAVFKPKEVGDVAGKAALKKITEYIRQAAEKKTNTKFILLSAHDVTTLGVMSALHAPLDAAPSYASDLNFSLYESGSKDYFVTVSYNEMPVNIPGCNGNRCSLNQLMSMA